MRQLILCSILFLAAGAAPAQIAWQNPVSGGWNTPANWVGGNVPDTVAEVAEISVAGTYAISFNFSPPGIGGLLLTNPNATVNIDNGRTMAIGGTTWTNDGLVVVNTTAGASTTTLRTDVPSLTLAGDGAIRLNASASDITSANISGSLATNVLVNSAEHRILGRGRIGAALINNGLVQAGNAGERLVLLTFPKTNNATIEAVNGAAVDISGITVTNGPAGTIRADGVDSVVSYIAATVAGGSLSATNGGLGAISGASSFSDLTLSGPHQTAGGSTLAINGSGITNNGDITVNVTAGAGTTSLRIDSAAAAIGGTGSIRLNANTSDNTSAQISALVGGNVLTLGAGQTVFGTGEIEVATINDGIIDASFAGEPLDLQTNPKTNNNIMRATGGGSLVIQAIAVANNGQIVADGPGSVVAYSAATINGGSLSAVNGGLGAISGASSFSDLTLSGPHQTAGGSILAINGSGITNNGDITVNASGSATTTSLRTDAAATTIGGTGAIHLNANHSDNTSAQLSTLTAENVLTLGAGQSVSGTGEIHVAAVNNGLIDANVGGEPLDLQTNPKTNNNIMRATGGGNLRIESITVTNNGQIVADGADSVVGYSAATINGGSLSAVNGGLGSIAGTTRFNGVTVGGPHQTAGGSILAIDGSGMTNNGDITINSSGSASTTTLRTDAAAVAIGGAGTIRLNANTSDITSAQLATAEVANVLTMGSGQILAGRGRISVICTVHGKISPGAAAGDVGLLQQSIFGLTMTPSATYEVDLNGLAAGQFDTFAAVSGATLHLDGTLRVRVGAGFTPLLGDEFVIMTNGPRTGTFEQIVTPTAGPANAWRVRYEPTRVVLTVTCPPDISGDHVVGLDDLATLLSNFGVQSGALGEEGDVDGDGDVDLSDLAALLASFGGTCP